MIDRTRAHDDAPEHVDVERLLDAMFAGELDDDGAERLSNAVLRNANAAKNVARTRWLIESLRKRPAAPDLTNRILADVGSRRPWASARVSRIVTIGRIAASFALLAALTGALVTRRMAPELVMPGATGGPLTNLVEHGGVEVADGVRTVLGVVRTFRPISVGGAEAGAYTVADRRAEPRLAAPTVWIDGEITHVPTPIRFDPNQPRTIWLRAAPAEGVEARVALFRAH